MVEQKKTISDVHIMPNFRKVYPEDFRGVPPDMQFMFRIDLVLSAGTKVKAHYHLAPPGML